jgi:hypothetical protein
MRRSRSTRAALAAAFAAALALAGCGGGESNEAADQEQPKADRCGRPRTAAARHQRRWPSAWPCTACLNKRNGLSRDLRLKPARRPASTT